MKRLKFSRHVSRYTGSAACVECARPARWNVRNDVFLGNGPVCGWHGRRRVRQLERLERHP